DYNKGVADLPKSNVLEFNLEGDTTVVIRPSGTEPKLKIYYLVKGDSAEAGEKLIEELKAFFKALI
ncbi:MAG: phospho-sugar mutase, partial [Lachnospiraceae bacterium]|nr:phospho-sugar mutase [Lachnospiraceae bacterium]